MNPSTNMKPSFVVAFTVFAFVLTVGCGRAAPAAPTDISSRITGVTIRADSTQLTFPGQMSVTAVAMLPNGTLDVTARAVWNSDDPRVAIIAPGGLVTAVGYGTARISATLPSLPNVAAPIPVEITVLDTRAIVGLYRVALNASKSCQLPAEAMSRTYTATMSEANVAVKITLSGPHFWTTDKGMVWNTLFLDLRPNSVIFKVNDIDSALPGPDQFGGGAIAEQLPDSEYLAFYGTGEAPALSASFTAIFAGTISVIAPPLISDTYGLIATCTAADHQLVFTRIAGDSTVD